MSTNYPSFPHQATELSAFSFCIGIFIISLKNKQIIHFVPDDVYSFNQWLEKHGIRDINKNEGIHETFKRSH